MDRMEHVRALRNNTEVHYNCCQSILVPFAQEMGMTEEQAFALGAHFGAGMRHGATCGTLTEYLMVLGTLGYDAPQSAQLLRDFKAAHGSTDCAVLLKESHDRGMVKKDHCDDLVYEVAAYLEQLTAQK